LTFLLLSVPVIYGLYSDDKPESAVMLKGSEQAWDYGIEAKE